MSKTAMLVMGYREPAVLRSAIPIYEASDCDIYVHVDAKMELSSYASLMGIRYSGVVTP
jgi:ribosomal protein L30E